MSCVWLVVEGRIILVYRGEKEKKTCVYCFAKRVFVVIVYVFSFSFYNNRLKNAFILVNQHVP